MRSGPLITGGALAGAGAMLVLAGLAVGGAHLFSATRAWVRAMEVPPSERVRQQWTPAKAAAAGGSSAWQNGSGSARPPVEDPPDPGRESAICSSAAGEAG